MSERLGRSRDIYAKGCPDRARAAREIKVARNPLRPDRELGDRAFAELFNKLAKLSTFGSRRWEGDS